MKILFVCRANIGRSQTAEAIFKSMYPDMEVASAGTRVTRPEADKNGSLLRETPGADKVLQVLTEDNLDHSQSLRTQITKEMLDYYDRIIVMAEPENIPEWLSSSPKFTYWEVPDMKGTTVEVHREIRDQIKSLIEKNKNLFE